MAVHERLWLPEVIWLSPNATCNCQVPYGDRSHLFRLAAVLGSKRPRQVPAASNVPYRNLSAAYSWWLASYRKILKIEGSSVNLRFYYNLDLEKLINTDILTTINYEIRKFTEEPFRFTSLMHISAISFVKHTIISTFHSIVYSASLSFQII